VAIIALVALVAGCTGSGSSDRTDAPSSAASVPTTDPTDRVPPAAVDDPVPPPVDWMPCAGGLDCATLTVPLDYDHPGAGTVDLALVRRPATDPGRRIGPLVVNPGGPGGSGIEMVRDGYGTADGLDQQFDIVSWDPRGVGGSTPLQCGDGAGPFLALDRFPGSTTAEAALDDAARAVADDCGAHAGPLLDHVDSTTTARDIEQLRRALRVDQLSYAGYSYGTAIGLAYLERFPNHVRAMVLDGVVQPEWDLEQLLGAQTNAFDQSIDVTFNQCDSHPSCPVHDARATYDRVAARLATDPLPSANGTTFGPTDLAVAAISSAYDPDRSASFVQGLADADHGDAARLQKLVDRYRTAVASYATYAAVVCSDLPHPDGADAYRAFAARLAARSPRFGAVIANEMLPCAFWPAPVTGILGAVTAPDAPPSLVIGRTGDPATPYDNSVAVASTLHSAHLVTSRGDGHTSYNDSSCVHDVVDRYLLSLDVPGADPNCD